MTDLHVHTLNHDPNPSLDDTPPHWFVQIHLHGSVIPIVSQTPPKVHYSNSDDRWPVGISNIRPDHDLAWINWAAVNAITIERLPA